MLYRNDGIKLSIMKIEIKNICYAIDYIVLILKPINRLLHNDLI